MHFHESSYCLLPLMVYTNNHDTRAWFAIPTIPKQTVFRMVCKTHLEGGGREWPQKGTGLTATFQNGQNQHLFLPTGLSLTMIPKNLLVSTFKEDEKDSITGLLSNWQPPSDSLSHTPSYVYKVLVLWYETSPFFCGVSSATRTKPGSSFIREWHTLHSVEEVWRFMLPRSPPDALSSADQSEKEISSFEKVLVSAGNDTSEDITEGKDWNRFFS